ncbi:hypothetical protein M9H77_35338 [Catharanthus roseus]|uniref:Uncharacterized protein n=1 Tax=Catharanthus roseus TaxID=4058 RepID=A0ACB9ZPF8_CATRO|nr:hypothetical protein M9H77_35338 [Catharanthus roseus]
MESNKVSPPSTTIGKLSRTISRTSSGGGSGSIILNKYQLGRLLGRGSFAKVYYGRSLEDQNNVAVKVIDKNSSIDGGLMEEFLIREVSAMRRLNHHPNILKLHEVMATKSKIYLVMELAPGGELFSKLQQRGRFSETVGRGYFHQLISALHFCHQNGVTHRDIKPQNLLLDQNGNLKISDFGLSALPEQLKNGLLHTACGTPAYTAPEVVYRKGYDGAKADAWSCGVILYIFLVGSLPYDDSNLPIMYRAIHKRAYDMPDWVSKPARNIIYRLLDPNPSTRLSIEELMKLSWFKKSEKGIKKPEEICNVFPEKGCKNYLSRMNAFDIISMSSGLNLSGLFEVGLSKKEIRFTSSAQVVDIEERVVKVGGELGYKVERGKAGGLGLVKGGSLILIVEILEVAQELWLVEMKVMDERRTIEFQESQWEELKVGLGDIALAWYNEYDCS